jgi:hypothetical protein
LLPSSGHRPDALMMKATRTSKTLVNFYQTTLRYNPEDSHLHTLLSGLQHCQVHRRLVAEATRNNTHFDTPPIRSVTFPSLSHIFHSTPALQAWLLPARIVIMRTTHGDPNVALRSHANPDVTCTLSLASFITRVATLYYSTLSRHNNVRRHNSKTTYTPHGQDFIM